LKLAAALAALLLAVANPAPVRAADPPPGMVEVKGGLRHEATGISLPKWLKGLRRHHRGGNPIVAIYIPSSRHLIEDLNVSAGIARVPGSLDRARLSHLAWSDMGKIAVPEVIAESSFAWPGHPNAVTFYGAYNVGYFRKTYWQASDGGWHVLVVVTTLRDRAEKMEELSRLAASEIFGGATLAAASQP
jgi:hypothetical protein